MTELETMNHMNVTYGIGRQGAGAVLPALILLLHLCAGCTAERVPDGAAGSTRGFGSPNRLEIGAAIGASWSVSAGTASPSRASAKNSVKTSVSVRTTQDPGGIFRMGVSERTVHGASDAGLDAGTVPKGVWVMEGTPDTLSLRLRRSGRADLRGVPSESGGACTKATVHTQVPGFTLWRTGSLEGTRGIIDIDGDVVERDGDAFLTSGRYRADAVPDGGGMRYLAFAPAGASGLTPDRETLEWGGLKASVTLGSQADAVDWLAGASPRYTQAPSRPELSFRHIMAQVRVVSTLAVDWKVERVEFTGVNRSGAWSEWEGWTAQCDAGDCGVDVDADLSGGPAVIADGETSLLCIPQSCPEGAKVRIRARHRTRTDIVQWLEAPVAGDLWEEGRTATYELTPLSLGYSISLSNDGRVMAHQSDDTRDRWYKYLYCLTTGSLKYDQNTINRWANDGDINLITITPPTSVSGQILNVSSSNNAVCKVSAVTTISTDGWHEAVKVQLLPVARGNCTIDVSYGTESASFACQVAASPTVEMDGPGYYIGNTTDYINVRYSYDTDADGAVVVEDPSHPVAYESEDPATLSVDEAWYEGSFDRIWISTHNIDYDYVPVGYAVPLWVTMVGIVEDEDREQHQVKPLPMGGTCTDGDYIVTEGSCSGHCAVTCDGSDFSFFHPGKKVNIWYDVPGGGTETVELRVNCCIGLIWRQWEGGGQTRGLNLLGAELQRNDGTASSPRWTTLYEENGDPIWATMEYYDVPVIHLTGGMSIEGEYRLRCTTTGSDYHGVLRTIYIPVDLV